MIQNIQTLFASIHAEEVRAYLSRHGWRLRASSERLDFDKFNEATGETRTLLLPASESHPKFRRLLPNLIFSLAVLEQREALEIANEIYASKAPAIADCPTPATSAKHAASKVTACFRNIASVPSEVTVIGTETVWQRPLQTGDEIWVQLNTSSASVIGFAGQLEIKCSNESNIISTVLLGLPSKPSRRTPESWMEWFRQRLAESIDLPSEAGLDLLTSIDKLVKRFVFAVGQSNHGEHATDTQLRFTAQFICELSQRLREHEMRQSVLFESTRNALADAGLTFNLDPRNSAMLWEVCISDDPNSPVQTLDWLKNHTHQIT